MKIILLVLLGFCFVTLNARLIEKITDRTLTTETKTTGSSPPVRLTRDVYEEDSLTGFSKEENVQSDEFVQKYNRRARHFFKSKPPIKDAAPAARVPRESQEKVEKVEKVTTNTTTSPGVTPPKQKITLVKKPIPKYNEMDYDDDFQMKISRSPVRVVDSGEHEDEDFNLDDYDFDVNHDEFIGRGKPLEPRTKQKESERHPAMKQEMKPVSTPEVKIQSKVVSPVTRRTASNKKERAAQLSPKKAGEKDDYYDDTTTTKAPESKARDLDDEFNEENEESKEFDGKMSSVRMVRSPWKINSYVDKLGEKTSSVMAKVLSILPMFPQVPYKNTEDEKMNEPPMDPWLGKNLTD